MLQRSEYQKSLDDKELNLTSAQKNALLEISDKNYQGLSRDPYGRYVGMYRGDTPDKNMDVNKWIDDRMKDFAIQKGGSEIQNSNGHWMIKRGTKWERLAPGTIEDALSSAMANSADYQGYRNMMGKIAGHNASKVWTNPALLPDTVTGTDSKGNRMAVPNTTKRMIMAQAQQLGIPYQEVADRYFNRAQQDNIDANALRYARTKYAVNNVWSESGMDADPFALKAFDPKANPLGEVDLVTGPGVNVGARLGATGTEMETRMKQSTENINAATTSIDQQRQRVARAIGTDMKRVGDADVVNWLTTHDPQELGKYRTNREAVEASARDLADMNQVRDAAMDAAVKKATGGQNTFSQLKSSATRQFQDAIRSGTYRQMNSGIDGQEVSTVMRVLQKIM